METLAVSCRAVPTAAVFACLDACFRPRAGAHRGLPVDPSVAMNLREAIVTGKGRDELIASVEQ